MAFFYFISLPLAFNFEDRLRNEYPKVPFPGVTVRAPAFIFFCLQQ